MAILLKAKKLVLLQQALGTKVSRTLAAVASGGSSLHSGFTVLERKENYCVITNIIIIWHCGCWTCWFGLWP